MPTGLQNDTLQQLTMPTSTSFWNLRAAGPERVKRAVPLPCSLLLMMATASSSVSAYMTDSRMNFISGANVYNADICTDAPCSTKGFLAGCMQIFAATQQHVSMTYAKPTTCQPASQVKLTSRHTSTGPKISSE